MNNRIGYLDILRVIAAMMVVSIHSIGYFLLRSVDDCLQSPIMEFLRYAVRGAVPLFFMISGAVWLSPEKEVTAARVARALGRLLIIYFFWNFLYAIIFDFGNYSIFGLLKHTWKGHFHMWFFEYLIGVYLLIPLFRTMVANKPGYVPMYVLLFALFGIMVATANSFPYYSEEIRIVTSKVSYDLVGFSGYFLTGYWLHSVDFKRCTFLWGAMFFLVVLVHCLLVSVAGINFSGTDAFSIFVFVESCSLFLFVKDCFAKYSPYSLVRLLSGATLGVFLIHPLLVEKLNWSFLGEMPLLLAWLVMFSLLLFCSVLATLLMKRIPVINKWIV